MMMMMITETFEKLFELKILQLSYIMHILQV